MFATEMLQGWDEILLSGSANIALKKEKNTASPILVPSRCVRLHHPSCLCWLGAMEIIDQELKHLTSVKANSDLVSP